MTNLLEKLRLKEMAEEDIYFARRDRELIEALRRRGGRLACGTQVRRYPPSDLDDASSRQGPRGAC
jgi:hypothetical protein